MADDAPAAMVPRPRSRWGRRYWLSRALFLLVALVAAALAAVVLLDTGPGRRFIIDQIEAQRPESGLRIRIGRIDGSIFSDPVLRDVQFADPDGRFLTVAEAQMRWHPFDFILRNRLSIDSVLVPRADLSRFPRLLETDDDKPILPDFDIAVGRFDVRQLRIGAAVAGRPHTANIEGRALVTGGSADVHFDAALRDGGDRIRVALVAAPDRGDFDIDADLVAPGGGVIAAVMGSEQPVSAVVRGEGDWARWQGALLARSGSTPLASVRLNMLDGRMTAVGRLWPEQQLSGLAQRLSAGGIAIDADGRVTDRRWDGRVALVSPALQMNATGRIDVDQRRFGAMRVDTRLRRNEALGGNVVPTAAQLAVLLDGPFAAPRYEYRLSAQSIAIGATRLSGVDARGTGAAARGAMGIPVALRVNAITGVSGPIDRALAGLRADGLLVLRDAVLSAEAIRLSAAGLTGRLGLRHALRTADTDITLDGGLSGLELSGLGRVDVAYAVRGQQSRTAPLTVGGRVEAMVRRFDNGFLRSVAGGGPDVRANILFGADRVLRLSDVRLTAPLLDLSGSGQRLANGEFAIDARGAHRRYGPLALRIDGPINRPRVEARLQAPFDPAQLSDVRIVATPADDGFVLEAAGQSILGAFDATGAILLPRGRQAALDITRLSVGGTIARGRLGIATGGLVGQLLLAGGGVDGRVLLSLPGGTQSVVSNLTARNARFDGPQPIAIARGQMQATLLLDPAGTDIDATFETVGLSRGPLSIARLAGTVRLTDGRGNARVSVAGSRGRDFSFQSAVAITPDRYVVRGSGSLARAPIQLSSAAVITRREGGWALAPVELRYAGGRMQLSGLFAASSTRIEAGLDTMPLGLLDLAWPDLGLSGRASGRLTYADGAGAPAGTAQLRITGLTRAGLVDYSEPVDVALNAALSATSAAARAVVSRNGANVGRAQLRLSPLRDGGDLSARLLSAPMFGQVRYDGDAGTLWRLTGVESLSIGGAVAIAADMAGTLNDPTIRGTLRARGARVESLQAGTVITDITATGQFDGANLRLRDIRGVTPGGGSITGSGNINLAVADVLNMDMRIEANRALLIDRDDLVARVTGPIRLSSDEQGGLISGRVQLNAGRFRLGQATAAEALPVINVVEVNAPADRPTPLRRYRPWRLDLAVAGRNGFVVTGLGLESEWSTDLVVQGDVANFSIAGAATLVRGDYIFAGRRFELESGTIRFNGLSPPDPALDIVAVDDIAGIDASIRVRGSGYRPEVSFTSVPALPEDELLSRILFGASITDISVTEAAQLGLALASLRSGGDLDPINAIRRATGIDRLRILPADTALGTGTSVAAGKYVTRRVYVEVITDGQGYSATRAEYQITRWLALLGSISTLGRESASVRIQRNY